MGKLQFSQKNELQELMHSYGCVLYQPGESILKAGTSGNCAFVIGEGEVALTSMGHRMKHLIDYCNTLKS